MTAAGEFRYYIVQHEGDAWIYEIQDTVRGRRVRDGEGYTARFLTEAGARAAVPADETDPGLAWG